MWLSVQELVLVNVPADCCPGGTESVDQQQAVVVIQRRGFVSMRQEVLSRGDSFHEAWRLDLDAAHRCMQAMSAAAYSAGGPG